MYDGITMDGSMQLLLFAFSAFDDWDIHRLSDSYSTYYLSIFTTSRLLPTYNR